MKSIMIADDHMIAREGIKKLLENNEDFQVVAEVSDGVECIRKLETVMPDILILDIKMPEIDGMRVLRILKEQKSTIKVFMMTAHSEIDYLVEANDLGVDAYALKNISYDEFISALYSIVENKTYIQTSLIPKLNNKLLMRDIDKDKIESLTRREMDMIIKIASGMSNKEIANTLNITERTVKNHISSLFKKIGVSDRTQAAVFAIKNNLIIL